MDTLKKLEKFISMLAALSLSAASFAQPDISGIWEGELTVNESTQITVLFTLEQNDDGYSASLNAPDQAALTDIAADSVNLSGTDLTIAISSISGEYKGAVDDGQIDGTWTQQGTSFPLVLVPYVAPSLTAEAMALLQGSWVGILRPIPNGDLEVPVVFRFEEQDGEFITLFDSPSEGAADLAVGDVELIGDQLAMTVTLANAKVTGTLAGDTVSGIWAQAGREIELILEKGEYTEKGLEISAEDAARLAGSWSGNIGPLTIIARYETSADGITKGYMDSPDQGAEGIPISSVSLSGDDFEFKIDALGGTFTGTLSDTEIVGTWEQLGQQMPTTLTKD